METIFSCRYKNPSTVLGVLRVNPDPETQKPSELTSLQPCIQGQLDKLFSATINTNYLEPIKRHLEEPKTSFKKSGNQELSVKKSSRDNHQYHKDLLLEDIYTAL